MLVDLLENGVSCTPGTPALEFYAEGEEAAVFDCCHRTQGQYLGANSRGEGLCTSLSSRCCAESRSPGESVPVCRAATTVGVPTRDSFRTPVAPSGPDMEQIIDSIDALTPWKIQLNELLGACSEVGTLGTVGTIHRLE